MIVNKYNKSGGSPFDPTQYYTKPEVDAEISGATEGLASEDYVDAAITSATEDFVTEADITAATSPIQTQLDDIERVTATALTELHNDILEISGSTPDLSNYYTKAETDAEITGATQGLATEAYVTAATSGLASTTYVDNAIEEAMTGFTPELPSYLDQEVLEAKEEVIASAITELQNEILDISGDTPDLSNYYTKAETDAEITGATQGLATQAYVTAATQGFITSAYTGFTKTEDFDDLVDMVETKEEVIASAITELHNEILDISGDTPDLSNYYTSAQTEEAISAATSGKADKQNVTARESGDYWPRWNSQGVITGERHFYSRSNYVNGNGFYTVDPVGYNAITIFAPTSAGTAGNILVSTGNGAPVWTTDNKVSSTSVSTIWKGTQAEYDAITTKDPNTFYIIVENQGE